MWPAEYHSRQLSFRSGSVGGPPVKRRRLAPEPVISSTNIQIRASSIGGSGGGVFYSGESPIKRGTLLGYYGGASVEEEEGQTHDYAIDGGRNPIDPGGRLKLNDGTEVRTNGWTSEDWNKQTGEDRYGVEWVSGEEKEGGIRKGFVPANWTRFMNTSTGNFLNVNMVTSGTIAARKYKAYAFVSCQPIYPGDELFWSYGASWLRSRGIQPTDPDPSKARPNWYMWPFQYEEGEKE